MKKEPGARQACAIFLYMNAMFSVAMTQGFSDCACSTSNALRIPCKNAFSQNFEECVQAGCCFDRTFFFFGNRCFQKNEGLCNSVTQQCNIPPQRRIVCAGILNPFLCELSGCCFDATTVFSVPQCYRQGTFATPNTPFNIIPTPFLNTPAVNAFIPGVSEWSQWSSCLDQCQLTYSIRRRTCMARTEQDCANVGLHTEEQMECLNTCRNWSDWSFGMCSATCGQGTMIRTRTCIGKAFTGPTSCNRAERQCMLKACPVSLWGTWLPWSECSNSCSSGERIRKRMCYDQFDRTTDVENCASSFAARPDQQTQRCNENLCQNWSSWSSLSECSKTCGNGAYRYAFRECSRLSTGLLGTAQYEACRQLTVICSLPPCPVRHVTFATIEPSDIHKTTKLTAVPSTSQPKRINLYNWQTWLSWSACSNQCGPGNRVRVRKCLNRNGLIESPSNCGNQKSLDEEQCNTNLCSKWGNWFIGSCSITCINIDGNSLGSLKSTRICQGREKSRAPDQCHSRVRTCQVTRLCPVATTIRTPSPSTESQFTKAVYITQTTTTSSTTMSTIQTTTPSTTMSTTTVSTTKEPPTASIWDSWGEWSTCSSTCAPGIQTRARECLPSVPIPLCNTGALVDSRTCNKAFCQEWSAWKTGGCDKTCGDGVALNERQCVSGHSLRDVSKTCYMSVDSCNSEPCGIVDTSPKPKVADSKRDILFLIDSSKYVDNCAEIQEMKGWKKPLKGKQVNEETTPNYARIKKFISDFVSGWNGISDSGSRISIQLFSNLCSPKTKFNLHMQKKFNDSHDDFVANYIENMPYYCGDFWLSWALQCSVTPIFTTAYGDRKTVPNLVVAVISNAPTTSQPSARLLKFVLKKLALKKTTVISVAATHFDELSASARKRYEENLRLLSCPLKNKKDTKCSNYIGSIWNKEASNPAQLIRQALKSIDKS